MTVDIVGEDAVTQEILAKIINSYRADITIGGRLPARGGQIKQNALRYNALGSPVFLLTDLDTSPCPPGLIREWFGNTPITENMLFRIAYDETESWLMADREGFAEWLNIRVDLIPASQQVDKRNPANVEMRFPYKPSLYMMRDLASQTNRTDIKDALTPREGAKKGPGYNGVMVPFIKEHWNIERAMPNSYSLQKAVSRITEFMIEPAT